MNATPADSDWGMQPVCGGYEIVDEGIRAQLPVAERTFYAPAAHSELVTEFAKLARAPELLLEFAQRRGLLGFAALAAAPPAEGLALSDGDAEAVGWWLAHATGVQTVLRLHDALSGESDLSAIVTELSGRPRAARVTGPAVTCGDGVRIVEKVWAEPKANPEIARQIMAGIVNPNLRGATSRQLVRAPEAEDWPGLVSQVRFPTLLSAIYWHLADLIDARGPLGRCLECGSFFPKRTKRRRYCPPDTPRQPRAAPPQSLCGARARKRAHRRQARDSEIGAHASDARLAATENRRLTP